jgi:mannosyltransferase OCH1-like enzyme
MLSKKIILILILISVIVYISIQINNVRNHSSNNIIYNNKSKDIIKRNNNINVKFIEEEKIIPKKILQTYKTFDSVPSYVVNNIKKLNQDWEYCFYDDNDCINFLNKEFGKQFVDKFNSFEKGAHKSDLFRICWLYINGGVYIDIDTELIIGLNNIVKNVDYFTILQNDVATDIQGSFIYNFFKKHDTLINSFMVINKGNKYIKKCIENIMKLDQQDLKDYPIVLFVMQNTLKDNINYQLFERRPQYFSIKRMEIYDKYDNLLGYSCYEKYKKGEFKD